MWIGSASVRRPIPEAPAQATFPHTRACEPRILGRDTERRVVRVTAVAAS